jgi:hypothetical protein
MAISVWLAGAYEAEGHENLKRDGRALNWRRRRRLMKHKTATNVFGTFGALKGFSRAMVMALELR